MTAELRIERLRQFTTGERGAYTGLTDDIACVLEALSVAKLAHDMMKPWEKATLDYAQKHREACEQIVALSAGWDVDGSTGPKHPLSWESAARCAMDYAKYAIAATAANG